MKIFLFIFSLLALTGCNSKDSAPDCQKFRKGKFRLVDRTENSSYIITRNDSLQTELDLGSDITSRFRIKWIDDCTYEALYLDQDKMDTDLDSATLAILADIKKTPTFITITYTGADYYVFEAIVDKNDGKVSDTLWLMK